MGDPEHFKPYYAGDWAKHRDDTQELKKEITSNHPEFLNTIKLGYGADSAEYKEFSPDEKAEPSITLLPKDVEVGCIWVTGSDKINDAIGDIWLRPDKLNKAKIKSKNNVKCWFYFKYNKARYVMELEDVLPYEKNIVEKNLKGINEKFVSIPKEKGKSIDILHEWLGKPRICPDCGALIPDNFCIRCKKTIP